MLVDNGKWKTIYYIHNEWATMEQIAASNSSIAESAKGLLTLVKGNYYFNKIEKSTPINPLGKTASTKSTAENSQELTVKNNLFAAYPNPTDGKLYINYHLNNTLNNATISVTDALGKTVLSKSLTKVKGIIELDTKEWANGTYFLQLINYNKTINTNTIIVTH